MIGIVILTVTALLLGIMIVLVDSKVRMSKLDRVRTALPGYNCGVCGYGGCEGMANAILKKKDNYLKCKLLKEDDIIELEKTLKK